MAGNPVLLPLLPSVEKLLASPDAKPLLERYPRAAVVEAVRIELDRMRVAILDGRSTQREDLNPPAVVGRVARRLEDEQRPHLTAVINATGVVLHTNLGRAPIALSAAEEARGAALGACTLEYDLVSGGRGHRDSLVERHITALTGAEAATVVNNNAAAVLLLLNTFADGREVVVSRGELVEIGGSFRIPEIMRKGGAILREVGTTNRTHLADYERAVGPDTAILLKVHTSNFRVVGFTASVELAELRQLADRLSSLIVAEDLGSGALVDLAAYGLGHEPLVAERIAAGADVVTFSGDKLLGGPQCGILAGKRELVDALRRNPLSRALRCDKMTLAALEETLRLYRFGRDPVSTVPVLAMITRSLTEIESLAERARSLVSDALGPGYTVETVTTGTKVGAGARPDLEIESRGLAIVSASFSADEVARLFRSADPPIIGRVEKDRFVLDLRTVADPRDVIPRLARA